MVHIYYDHIYYVLRFFPHENVSPRGNGLLPVLFTEEFQIPRTVLGM